MVPSKQHCLAVASNTAAAAESTSKSPLSARWSEEVEKTLVSRQESKCAEESDVERRRNWTGEDQVTAQ